MAPTLSGSATAHQFTPSHTKDGNTLMTRTVYKNLETAFIAALKELRTEFSDRDIGQLRLRVEGEGRTLDGDMKIVFTVDGTYEHREVVGATLEAVKNEFFRRNNWQKANDFLALPKVETPSDDH